MAFWIPFARNFRGLVAAGLVVQAASAAPTLPPGQPVERMVAVVNGKVILLSELQDKAEGFTKEMERQKKTDALEPRSTLQKRVLDQMINELLVDSEIERRGLSATESTVDGAVNTVMKQNRIENQEDFKRVLRDEGMTLEEYRKTVKRQIENSRLINEVIRPRVQISDADIDAAFQRKLSTEGKQWKYRVQMIFKKGGAESKKKVEALRKEILAGASFEKVADRETEGAGKGEGGAIGEVSAEDLQPQIAKVLETLPEGGISEAVETSQGSYLIKNLKRVRSGQTISAESKDQLREKLTQEETARQFDLFVRGLRDKAQIEVVL